MSVSRAEARRKAILSRGTERLAKLTTLARGEGTSAYMRDDSLPPKISTSDFVGEATVMLPPSPFVESSPSIALSEPRVWSEEQQQQFSRHSDSLGVHSNSRVVPLSSFAPSSESHDDSGTVLMNASPPTRWQKAIPLVHLVAVWGLLAYFVLQRTPTFDGISHSRSLSDGRWRQWAELCCNVGDEKWVTGYVPLIWTFLALQLSLHSFRILAGSDVIQPPLLLSLILPHIPPPFPSLIVTTLKYVQIGGAFLDDMAGLVVGLGVIVGMNQWFFSVNE